MEQVKVASKNQSTYYLGNHIYKFLTNQDIEWIKYLIKISKNYHHTLFPIDYFTDDQNQLKGIILPRIPTLSSITSLSTDHFLQNSISIQQEFLNYTKDGILPIDCGYHNSIIENNTIYLFDTDEFQPKKNIDSTLTFNYYIYDLIKNTLYLKCQQEEIQFINTYFKTIQKNQNSIEYIQKELLNYSTLEQYATNIKRKILTKESK